MSPWLGLVATSDGVDDPAQHAEMADSLSLAMLVVLESLSPEQRAALLLHDVFDYGYREIAEIIGKSEDNVRQLASRARRHVEERRDGWVQFQTSHEQREEPTQRFLHRLGRQPRQARAPWGGRGLRVARPRTPSAP